MNDVENDQLNVLEIVVEHHEDKTLIEDVTLCRTEVYPTVVERPASCREKLHKR